jgi:hypothetical protein
VTVAALGAACGELRRFSMRKVLVATVAAAALAAMAGEAQAQGVPRHFHLLSTPSGDTHAIAGGLTTNAPCQAFLNFHGLVHMDVFGTPTVEGRHPLGPLAAQVVMPIDSCP